MRKFLEEFKQFALKGNVIDLAVGVIIGGAFSKIVSSLVSDVVMPLVSIITGRVSFKDLKIMLIHPAADGTGGVFLTIGTFIENVVDFLIIAVCIFFIVKGINTLNRIAERRRKQESVECVPEPSASDEEIRLLSEIRDLLSDTKK